SVGEAVAATAVLRIPHGGSARYSKLLSLPTQGVDGAAVARVHHALPLLSAAASNSGGSNSSAAYIFM
ncbi:unnamed protein product, partial [Closterium sp. Yama58-4]